VVNCQLIVQMRTILAISVTLFGVLLVFSITGAQAAANLQLAPALSFSDDSSANFPITGSDLAAGPVAGKATVIFFGTSNCWNTAREAERLVKLYPQYRNQIDFVVVDLNRVSPDQQGLVSRYYRGAIPTVAVLDSKGNLIYDRAGETAGQRGDTNSLQKLLDSAH
jgi:ABC-type antimicrobial peptide transport system permease subunit